MSRMVTSVWVAMLLLTLVRAESESSILQDLLQKSGYNKYLRPGSDNDQPTNISVQMYVRGFRNIDIKNMNLDITITLRQYWEDPRLQFTLHNPNKTYITVPRTDMVWKPDTFIRNEIEARIHSVMEENSYVRVFPDGGVLYSVRMTVTMSCPMNLRTYPFDTQTCCLQLASYGEHSRNLVYDWKAENPVQFISHLSLPHYQLVDTTTGHCDVLTSTGQYSCVKVMFKMSTNSSNMVLEEMIPSMMWVILSWAAFWLRKDNVVARLGIAALSLYSLKTQQVRIISSLPSVAYTKAIDTWTGTCVFFVFLALVEVVIVNYLGEPDTEGVDKKSTVKNFLQKFKTSGTGAKMDFISRVLFPVVFFIFVIAYFAYYINQRGEDKSWFCYV